MSHIAGSRPYSRAEYISDAIVHASGIGAALIGGPLLIALAVLWTGEAGVVTAVSVYVVTGLAMWSASAAYNLFQVPAWVDRLRRMDQSAIYLKIAGTYTPFAALAAGQAGFLAGIWAVAGIGAALILFTTRLKWLAIPLYLGLGWAGALWGGPLVSGLGPLAFWLLVVGGVTYSSGIAFLLWERLPFHNTIWHVFVFLGSLACYAAIAAELWRGSVPI
ncbi:PAQR family membrane homeostasis protein TrhA [Roseicyclus marinus]|uniref:PAQR family membrane homeostasis protein TrhA n=1 Tax=Roseicyclus marinus TaxID=2161673 RepID=UPI0024100A56|nr:hemolysin III family protein [Roseicyclus marinus]MDG3042666.1 hemolysin III family protein [Roseicyclus marinus]